MRPDPLTRHQDAQQEIGHTEVSPAVAQSLVAVFVVLLVVPALLQTLGSAWARSDRQRADRHDADT